MYPFRKRRPREDAGISAAALRRAGKPPSQGSGALAGSTAPGRLGPAVPHGGGRPLGRRPSLPYWGGSGSLPWSLDIVPVSGPHLVPGHGCGSSGLGTDETLTQRQKYRSMEQNRKPRGKSTHIWTPYLCTAPPPSLMSPALARRFTTSATWEALR